MEDTNFFQFLKKRVGILDGVCVTGGEPLLQRDIAAFLNGIKELGFAVKLDTNGSFPELLIYLVKSGLVDYVAMDIKNSLPHYGKTVGIEPYDTAAIEKSAAFLLENTVEYEFRTTVVRELHTIDDFISIGCWLKNASRFYLQAFVDSGEIIGTGLSGYSHEEMEFFVNRLREFIPAAELRGI